MTAFSIDATMWDVIITKARRCFGRLLTHRNADQAAQEVLSRLPVCAQAMYNHHLCKESNVVKNTRIWDFEVWVNGSLTLDDGDHIQRLPTPCGPWQQWSLLKIRTDDTPSTPNVFIRKKVDDFLRGNTDVRCSCCPARMKYEEL